ISAVMALFLLSGSASAQVKLERKYKEGSQFKAQVTSSSKQTLTLNGMNIDTKSSMFMVQSTRVGHRGSDGTLPLETKTDVLQTETMLPGGITVNYDSGNPQPPAGDELRESFGKLYEAMQKTTTVTKLDRENRIKAVELHGDAAAAVGDLFKSQFD